MSHQTNQNKFKPTIKTIFTCKAKNTFVELYNYSKGKLSYMLLPKRGILLECTRPYCHNNGIYQTPIALTMGYIKFEALVGYLIKKFN